jgi:hypothetical protein
MPFNPSKVIDRVKPLALILQDLITIRTSRESILVDLTISFKSSVLISSLIYNEDTRSANAALLTELITRNTLLTPARTYAHYVIRREEYSAIRNIITEEEHEKLKAAVIKRKAFQSSKRQIIDEKHILTTPEVHDPLVAWEKNVKKRKTTRAKKGKREASEDNQESIDESEASQDEELRILDCIEVRKKY